MNAKTSLVLVTALLPTLALAGPQFTDLATKGTDLWATMILYVIVSYARSWKRMMTIRASRPVGSTKLLSTRER